MSDAAIPPMPWTIEYITVGEGPGQRQQAMKVVDGISLYASDEDVAVWNHVQSLARRIDAIEPLSDEPEFLLDDAAADVKAQPSLNGHAKKGKAK